MVQDNSSCFVTKPSLDYDADKAEFWGGKRKTGPYKDSLCVWEPEMPEDFSINFEETN